jgi:lipoprotein-releasing system permease protein
MSVLGAISHAYITGYGTTIENWQTLQAKINQHPNVVSTSPYIQKYALINASFGSQGIRIRGIQPKLEKKTSVLLDKIKSGNAELGKSNILIGTG